MVVTFSDESDTRRSLNAALEVRDARAPATLYVYLTYLVARQGWFTLMWRFETSNNVHVTSVVSLLHGRARSQSFTNDENKSPDMNLQYVFSEYVDFQSQVPPIFVVFWYECLSAFVAFDTLIGCLTYIVYIDQKLRHMPETRKIDSRHESLI